jgi:hypothetical protein
MPGKPLEFENAGVRWEAQQQAHHNACVPKVPPRLSVQRTL